MTRKRTAKQLKDAESPNKRVKFMDNISNESISDEENQEELSDNERNFEYINTRQRALKEKLKIKMEPAKKLASKRNVKKKKDKDKNKDDIELEKDNQNASGSTIQLNEFLNPKEIDNLKKNDDKDASGELCELGVVVQMTNSSNSQPIESINENDNLVCLFMDDNDVLTGLPHQNDVILYVGDSDAVILPVQSDIDNEHIENSNVENPENITLPEVVTTICNIESAVNQDTGSVENCNIENMVNFNTKSAENLYIENQNTKSTENCNIGNMVNLNTKSAENLYIENQNTKSAENCNIKNTDNLSTESKENLYIENIENKNIENVPVDINKDESKGEVEIENNLSEPEKIADGVIIKAVKKLKTQKSKTTKNKTKVSNNIKGKPRRSRQNSSQNSKEESSSPLIQQIVTEDIVTSCNVCDQQLDSDLKYFNGEPVNGFEEGLAIIDSKLLLFDGDEANVSTEDTRSYNKITSFSVYCKNNHLCHFDSGLIEKDVEIYLSGHVKPIHSEDPSPTDGVPGKRFGPIASWWITGFDIGEQPTVGLSTELGDYICMEPSSEYAPFMRSVMTKIYISKIVIEYLIYEPNASYEDLLCKLQTTPTPNDLLKNFTEDMLLYHAPFICDQVITFDDTAKPKEHLMVTAPCIRRLIDLADIRFEVDKTESPQKRKHIFRERRFEHKIDYREKLLRQVAEDKKENSGASELVDVLLPIDEKFLNSHIVHSWRCGVCQRCLRSRCRECKACSVRNYEACYQRRCFNREIMEENDEDVKDEQDFSEMEAEDSFTVYCKTVLPWSYHTYDIAWGTKPLAKNQNRTYYGSVYVDRELYTTGDFVDVRSANPGLPSEIMKIAYMYENEAGLFQIHACLLWSGKFTVLGDISDRKELFFVNKCMDIDVRCIVKKVRVYERTNTHLDNSMIEDQSQYPYVCQRSYDSIFCTFHDLEHHDEESREKYVDEYRYCTVCDHNNIKRVQETPEPFNVIDESDDKIIYESVRYKKEEYHVGSAVYLKPKSLYFKYPMLNNQVQLQISLANVDEAKFTEIYRKAKDEETSSKYDVPAPFDIGYITKIFTSENKLFVKVIKLYRPENTQRGEKLSMNANLNMVYWSNEDATLSFSYVVGKCYLAHRKSLSVDIDEWSSQGPDRFYFSQIYRNNEVEDIAKGECGCPTEMCDVPKLYPYSHLRTLNIFAGCGGLSLGLQQSGAVECMWAIEPDKAAAATYKLNNPDTAVFVGNCAEIMQKISKKELKMNGQSLPKKGEVDLLCATFPPECWRSINSVNTFKSSNIATFLVYLEHYQPSFFVVEADDVLLKRSIVLKLTLASFIRLGYQVATDLIQVGNFGAPQKRYRTVIIGAARGRALPDCPKSQHVFSKSACHPFIVIDNKSFQRRNWTESAPYRATTIRDAMLDLVPLAINEDKGITKYLTQPVSFYQRMLRHDLLIQTNVINHVCKDLGSLVHARMSQIPMHADSDWRDLPNIEFRLRDNTLTNKLIYSYNDLELGIGKQGDPRGVCSCSVGKRCKPSDVQVNTLIPWHLVHSGKRHGHWSGLYGKLCWNSVFVGTSTNPEPLAKKVPVIHPSKGRVLSVRECARAQGFPDSFIFDGQFSIHEMYRQIGNSTSPLLARAIGFEIAKSAALNGTE